MASIDIDAAQVAEFGMLPVPATPGAEAAATPDAPETKKSKKRSRAKAKPAVSGNGVVVVGNRFVCSYSGRVVANAIFIPTVDTACFANIPCALAWLEDNCKDATINDGLRHALATEYEQTLENIERAPKRELLADFGGNLFYDEWIGALAYWDHLTESIGLSVDGYSKRGTGTATKRGKGAAARVAFEAAMYVIAHAKGAGGCKKVNALDGAVEKGAKERLTPVAALRKLSTFRNTHEDTFQVEHVDGEGYSATTNVKAEGLLTPVDDKLINNIATQLVGHTVYGPALVIFTRKHSQKV